MPQNYFAAPSAPRLKSTRKKGPGIIKQAGSAALGGLSYIGGKLQCLTQFPITSAIIAMQEGKPILSEAVKPWKSMVGMKNVGENTEGFGGVMKRAGVDTQSMPGKIAAGVADFVLDPLLVAGPLGLTSKGAKAVKTAEGLGALTKFAPEAARSAEKLGQMGRAARLGEQALLTAKIPFVNHPPVTLIKGRPIVEAISKGTRAIKRLPIMAQIHRGMTGKTSNEAFNKLMTKVSTRNLIAKGDVVEDVARPLEAKIAELAKKTGMSGEEVQRKLRGYIEAAQKQNIHQHVPSVGFKEIEKKVVQLPKLGEKAAREYKSGYFKAKPREIRDMEIKGKAESARYKKSYEDMIRETLKFGKTAKLPKVLSEPDRRMMNSLQKRVDEIDVALKKGPGSETVEALNMERKNLKKELEGIGLQSRIDASEEAIEKVLKSGLGPDHPAMKAALKVREMEKGAEGVKKGVLEYHARYKGKVKEWQESIPKNLDDYIKKVDSSLSGATTKASELRKLINESKKARYPGWRQINAMRAELTAAEKAAASLESTHAGKYAVAVTKLREMEKNKEAALSTWRAMTGEEKGALAANMPEEFVKLAKEMDKKTAQTLSRRNLYETTPAHAREGYLEHMWTKELRDWADKLPEAKKARVYSVFDPNRLQREFNGTINEMNDYAQSGKLAGAEGFVGKAFEDDVPYLMAMNEFKTRRLENVNDFFIESGRFFGHTPEARKELMKAGKLKPEEWAAVRYKNYDGGVLYFDKETADVLNAMRSMTDSPEKMGAIEKFMGGMNQVYKNWTLPIYPSYHFRNMVGNVLNNMYAGIPLNPLLYLRAMAIQRGKKGIIKTAEYGELSYAKVMAEAKKRIENLGFMAYELNPEEIAKKLSKKRNILNWAGGSNVATDIGRKVGTGIENNARMAHFIHKLENGYTFDAAAESVEKYLFNYSDLGPWAKKAKNIAFPFLTWTLKNAPLQFEMMIKRPGTVSGFERFRTGFSGSERPDERYMSEYMAEGMPFYHKKSPEGKDKHLYFLGKSWLPAGDINSLLGRGEGVGDIIKGAPRQATDTAIGLLTPPIKELFAQAYNYDPFFKQPIQRFPGEQSKVTTPLGNVYLPAWARHAAQQFRPYSEAVNMMNQRAPLKSRLLRGVTGIKTNVYDLQKRKAEKIREARKELYNLYGLERYYKKINDKKNLERVQAEIKRRKGE